MLVSTRVSQLPVHRLLVAVAALAVALAVQLSIAPGAQAREVQVTVPATFEVEWRVYPDAPDSCVVLGHVMWKADPEAGTSATVHYSNKAGTIFSESGNDPFDDVDEWMPGLVFRVPAGSHWLQMTKSWQNGNGDCSEMYQRTLELYKPPFTATYTTTKPDPATITPLGRTVLFNRAGKAAMAVVRCPFDGRGACPVVLPRTTTIMVQRKRYTLAVTGVRSVPRGKSAIIYVKASADVRTSLKGKTIRPKVHITATKPGTKPTRRTVARSIVVR